MELLRFIFSNFWIWLGTLILIYIPFECICIIIKSLVKRSIILKQGWPPSHLDADGNWKPVKKENK